jgi:hypothetical protein
MNIHGDPPPDDCRLANCSFLGEWNWGESDGETKRKATHGL